MAGWGAEVGYQFLLLLLLLCKEKALDDSDFREF